MVAYQQALDNNAGVYATSVTWSTCPNCGLQYQGYHQCTWNVPAGGWQQPTPVWINTAPWRLADEDVERIARRVAELLAEKE
jgi:hypothetical protein